MEKYLLDEIKKLELELEKSNKRVNKIKKIIFSLKEKCNSLLNVTLLNSEKKEKILHYFDWILNLQVEERDRFFKNGYLKKGVFFKLVSELELSNYLFFIFRLKGNDNINLNVAYGYIESKFATFLSLDSNRIIGIIPKSRLKEFEKIDTISFFKDKYIELDFFVIFFEIAKLDEIQFKKAINLFDRFFLKLSFKDKSFIHYSLIEDRIIDFEAIEKEKIKREFSFIYELKYPELEIMIRKEIKNIKFLLVLLDRIDSELKEIKSSQGRKIVVKRILGFIFKNQMDSEIQKITQLLFQAIEDK